MPPRRAALYEEEVGYHTWGNINREDIKALPTQVGVYLFYGENTLPLYIGKSVNIRSRVLSHFRDRSEVNMMRQVKRITVEVTAGEIGALLRESQLIKQCLPLYNIRLRRKRALHSYILDGQSPKLIQSIDMDIASATTLYGMFASPYAAESRLRQLAVEHNLCLALLGLEKTARQGCFNLQLKKCQGACIGRETLAEHNQRLLHALTFLRMQAWPYKNPMGIIEQQAHFRQVHWIDNWCYLGTTKKAILPNFIEKPIFELDTYKILSKAILNNTLTLVTPKIKSLPLNASSE